MGFHDTGRRLGRDGLVHLISLPRSSSTWVLCEYLPDEDSWQERFASDSLLDPAHEAPTCLICLGYRARFNI